ncbi:MAG: DUF3179 domain-containing protein [Gemmatimonadales bacterium]
MKPSSIITIASVLTMTVGHPNAAFGQFGGRWKTDFSNHTVPLDEIASGGPSKDGIPAVDHPRFVTVEQADRWLDDREPVVVVNIGSVAKAYPLQILIWHEIVNDVVGDTPVTVTFCPLCNTALSFDRRFDGQVLDFGTTGRLRHSDLIMYDRQTETWWQQAIGEGIVGKYAGRKLKFISSPVVNWKTFKEQFKDGQVLSRETGHRRSYGQNPYAGYDNPRGGPFRRFFGAKIDKRLDAMERVVALELGDEVRAYPFSSLEKKRVVNDKVADREIVVFWTPGTASALDSRSIRSGRDVGSSGVFDRHLGERTLTFESAGTDQFRDTETGTVWNILGHGISGPLAGQDLTPIQHGNHFWFAWGVFKPQTKVVR